jgi:ankyrin repeat protein
VDLQKLMIKAAKKGEFAAVKALLDADPTLIDARDADGSTPLHCAAWKGNDQVVALLIERGASLSVENDNDHWGGTPLHAAAHGNNREAARLLLEHGADPGFRSRNGRTPLEETEFHNATAVAKLLRSALESSGQTA